MTAAAVLYVADLERMCCDGVDPEGNVIELREPLTAERDADRNG